MNGSSRRVPIEKPFDNPKSVVINLGPDHVREAIKRYVQEVYKLDIDPLFSFDTRVQVHVKPLNTEEGILG